MAVADSVSTRAEKVISALFSNSQLWTTLFPQKNVSLESLLTRPSSSSVSPGKPKYVFEDGVPETLQTCLQVVRERFLLCFKDHAHSESFWDNIMLQVRCSFATSLLSYRLNPKERSIIDGVVMPMLRMLIPSISLLPNSTCTGFRTHLLVEDSIPKMVSRAGRNPEVDIVVQLVNLESDTINLLPIEAKVAITKDHMSQLATYLFRLSSVEELRRTSRVGFLINGKTLQMCILSFSKDSLLLPIVLVSPPFAWMTDDGSNIITENLAILMVSIFLLKMEPVDLQSVEPYLVQLAQTNVSTQMDIKPPIALHPSFSQILSRLDEQALTIQEHAGAIEQLADLSRRNNPELPPTFGSPQPRKRQRKL